MGQNMMLVALIRDKGYPDWKGLARAIFAELAPDSNGELRSGYITSWLVHSLAFSKDDAGKILTALRDMGILIMRETRDYYLYKLSPNL